MHFMRRAQRVYIFYPLIYLFPKLGATCSLEGNGVCMAVGEGGTRKIFRVPGENGTRNLPPQCWLGALTIELRELPVRWVT